MESLKEKFLSKIEKKGSKKSIENLIVFVIIIIATIIFINYIWNGDKNNKNKQNQSSVNYAETVNTSNEISENNDLEKQLEKILINLEGVDDVKVLITYSETNKIVPMYNENIEQSTTKEEDNRRRC